MSSRSAWLMVLLFVLAVGVAERAGAVTTERDRSSACEDEGRSVEEAPHEVVAAEPARVILPCALAEHAFVVPNNGDPSCADATIYVVTDAGVLLCQIDVAALTSSTLPTIEQAPQATFSSSTAFSAAGIPALASTLTPPLVVDLVGALPTAWALPRDGHARPPSVPS